MSSVLRHVRQSPTLARALPFVLFLAITVIGSEWGGAARFWLYAVKSIFGAWALWALASVLKEMRWAFSWEAVVVGASVFGLWVGLDGFYPALGGGSDGTEGWNPFTAFEGQLALAWFFVIVRILGSTLVVPPLEEVFYRSFVYRYLMDGDFEKIPLNAFRWMPFLITSVAFGLAHFEWLPGILCGLLYQGLVIRKGRLGDAMTAHAITNFLLGVYVVARGAYHFW